MSKLPRDVPEQSSAMISQKVARGVPGRFCLVVSTENRARNRNERSTMEGNEALVSVLGKLADVRG